MSRARIRVGRDINYRPTDAQAAAGGGNVDDVWAGRISAVNADGTVNLHALEADGGELALTSIGRGSQKGQFDLLGVGPQGV